MSNYFDIIPNIVPKQGILCGKLPDKRRKIELFDMA